MILRALFFQNNEEFGHKGILGQPPRVLRYKSPQHQHQKECADW